MSAIVVAAGSSRRMAGLDKLWLDLGGAPLLARTLSAISAIPGLSQLAVVAGPETRRRAEPLAETAPWSRIDRWVEGGPTRQDSVFNGLQSLGPCDIVLIHDGARPLVTQAAIERGIAAARTHGAAISATPVTDTIKVVSDDGRVTATLDRRVLHAVQTPQLFAYELLTRAYDRVGAARAECTDDGAIVERAGFPVVTFNGERSNIKVSFPDDVAIVRTLWALREVEGR